MKKLSLIAMFFLLSIGGIHAEDTPINPGNNVGNKPIPRMDKPKTRLYEQAGLGFYDGSFEATGKIQADKFYEFVHISTPSTPATNHAREWLNNTTQRLCVRFDDGTQSCLGPGSSGGGALSSVGDPLAYDSISNSLTLGKIGISTGTVSQLPTTRLSGIITDSQLTNTFTSSKTFVGADLFMNNTVIHASGTIELRNQHSLALYEKADVNSVTLQAPTSIGTSYNMQVPSSQGAANSLLQNDGTGALTWASSNTVRGYISATSPVGYNSVSGVISLGAVSLSTGVTGVIGISTQTNLAATDPILLTSNVLSLGKVSLSTAVTGTLPDGNITNTFTSSKTFTSSSGSYFTYNVSAGSITARNIASGTQCVQADSSGNLSGTGTTCASGTGDAVLSSTQTWTGTNTFNNFIKVSSGIAGTTTNDNASAGAYGEFISSVNVAGVYKGFPNSGVVGDAASIVLTSGDWDVTFILYAFGNGATFITSQGLTSAITSTSGNSTTGMVQGDNRIDFRADVLANSEVFTMVIPAYRISIASQTTYYGKIAAGYSTGTPQYQYRLSARRVR